jgi:DNA-binding NarL/FixJ family response regulator
MGEETLNAIAHAEGMRAHEHAAELSSGDGFSMAAAAASALGGTVRLVLLEDGIVAKLELPDIAAVLFENARDSETATTAPAELSWLKIALVDDSAMFRKMMAVLAEKVTSRKPTVAGATRESIDGFPKMVLESDCDVLLLDFNFAPVHHTKTGVDVCRECRQLDAEAGNVPRLIFIVSANDSPEDAERYRAAGADGSLGKKLTPARLRRVLEDAVRTHPRFAAWRRGDTVDLAAAARQWPLAAGTPPQPSPRSLTVVRPMPRVARVYCADNATVSTS